ncbi:MAG: MATE family efflux transporter [Clostridia bacterium]|nr:MATE family efflux transporter [Clostridia bacterium]
MKIKLSDHFNYKRLIRFALPSIIMMVFTSIYSVVDGFFVSNFVGKTEFSAVNFIFPYIMMVSAVGFMFGSGGSALIAKTMGEGDSARANKQFSLFVIVNALSATVLAIISFIFLRDIAALFGAEGALLDTTVRYGRIILIALPAFATQNAFQTFFVTAEKPTLGLIVTIGAGVTNIVLDALFVVIIPLGLEGAAIATAISQVVGGVVPIIYFLCPNKSLLRIGKPMWDGRGLLKAVTNGSSELLANISMSLASMLFNMQLLKYAGEDGVAAYGVIMYFGFVFAAVFIGYSVGTSPVVSYHYGAKNHLELKNLLNKSTIIMLIMSVVMFAISELLARPVSKLFVGYDEHLLDMTIHAFFIYSFSYLASGYGIFSSGFFTALNDGLTSGVIQFMRTLVFQTIAVFTLPLWLGLDGIWLSLVVSEALSLILSLICLVIKRPKYQY